MNPDLLNKFKWSLPWLMRYPFWRIRELSKRAARKDGPDHLIIVIANHYEPAWTDTGIAPGLSVQLERVEKWCEQARAFRDSARDADGRPFGHTYFYPAEEYHPALLRPLAALQAAGLGEVEVHLHHGIDCPDEPSNLRKSLLEFRDTLADEHHCLSRQNGVGPPKYAFVHGNWALANSAGGKYCGVDSEMEILAETGCYADFTLPSAPDQSQVPRINAIYECEHALDEPRPHRSGRSLEVGTEPRWPVMITGPLVFDWSRRWHGLSIPRIDNGSLTTNYPLDLDRLQRWRRAHIGVEGRPEWVFIKLHCHAFLGTDDRVTIGDPMRRFVDELIGFSSSSGEFKVHFATAREAFNMTMAAVGGLDGDPGLYRDYMMKSIMKEARSDQTALRRRQEVDHPALLPSGRAL